MIFIRRLLQRYMLENINSVVRGNFHHVFIHISLLLFLYYIANQMIYIYIGQ